MTNLLLSVIPVTSANRIFMQTWMGLGIYITNGRKAAEGFKGGFFLNKKRYVVSLMSP